MENVVINEENIYQKGIYKAENLPKALPGRVLIRLLARSEADANFVNKKTGERSLIVRPDELKKEDTMAVFMGEVIKISEDSFKHKYYGDGVPQVKVGDFVMFERSTCSPFRDCGVPVAWISDTQIDGTVEDPSKISRIGEI